MDNNESWADLIELALKKVRNGIPKRIWEYEYKIDHDENTYWTFWEGKAVSDKYTIEIGMSECITSISAYSFVIKKGAKVVLEIIGQPYDADAPSILIKHHLKILKDTQEDFESRQ